MELAAKSDREGKPPNEFETMVQIIKNEIMQIGRGRWAQIQRDTW